MRRKRNPVKQIMSEVHEDIRAGRVKLGGHDAFVAEVKRRLAAAGLSEAEAVMPDLKSKRPDGGGRG
jgi:hypothetical protein